MNKVLTPLLFLISVCSFAQSPVSARLSSGYDVGMAYATDHYNPSIAYYQMLNVGERKLFSLGWTARLGAFYGDNLNYYTAPARLTRGKSGFAAIGAPLIENNIDTIRYDYVSMTSLNIGIRAQINLGKVELGASADLLGLAIGKSRIGRYKSSTGQFALRSASGADSVNVYFQGNNVFQKSSPSHFNVRLLGDNDVGTLATEVFARVHLTQRLAVKLGYQWLVTETKTENRDVIADNNRFRHRAGMAYLALTFPVFY
ncbi:hypothetical protein [Spirosoma gilvum]